MFSQGEGGGIYVSPLTACSARCGGWLEEAAAADWCPSPTQSSGGGRCSFSDLMSLDEFAGELLSSAGCLPGPPLPLGLAVPS